MKRGPAAQLIWKWAAAHQLQKWDEACGTCVVVVNGRAVKSSNFPIRRAQGAEILTVEGISRGMEVHPVQTAIAESGAVQCGFCTPSIVMELYALLEAGPHVSEREMVNALNKHLCRCNGYEPILNGARNAQQVMAEVDSRQLTVDSG